MTNEKCQMENGKSVTGLRSQSLDHPRSILLQTISQSIVQSVLASLPKLDRYWFHAITAPMRRARNDVAKLPTEFLKPLFEFGATFKNFTLLRSPGANFAAER